MNKKLQQGFTIIELLIVIAVIGVLAVAVLSAINPVEQIAKANDAKKLTNASTILNSLERYYATYQLYPWGAAGGASAPQGSCPYLQGAKPAACGDGVDGPYVDLSALLTTDEVKAEFASRDFLDYYVTDTDGTLYVCFVPASQSWTPKATYSKLGVVGGNTHMCVPGGG